MKALARQWSNRDLNGGSTIVERLTIYGNTRDVVETVREVIPCTWKMDELGHYDTECGNGFFFAEDQNLPDSKFKYCPYCGGPIC
jgi:hypothetical protein